MAKPYWTWTCHRCGHDDNRNINDACTRCNASIRCEDAGGHFFRRKHDYCAQGCGTHRNGTVDLSQRREDY